MEHLMVTAEWLFQRLDHKNIKIVEATFFLPTMNRDAIAEYQSLHIPDAVFFDIDTIADPHSELPHMLPSAEAFENSMQEMGLNREDHIIVYDRSSFISAARAWWMFRYFGHDRVSLLDGGLTGWKAAGYPLNQDKAEHEKGNFTASTQEIFSVVSMQQIADMLEAGTCPQIIDARAAERFAGLAPEPRAGLRAGHIPGAKNVPINSLFDAETMQFKSADELQALFNAAGVDFSQPAITSCGSGVTACGLIFGLALLGKTDVSLYDGSWTEWGASQHPVE